MAKKKTEHAIATIKFVDVGCGEISVRTDFGGGVSVEEMFNRCAQAIKGIILTCREIGKAKGMSEDEVDDALFQTKNTGDPI